MTLRELVYQLRPLLTLKKMFVKDEQFCALKIWCFRFKKSNFKP